MKKMLTVGLLASGIWLHQSVSPGPLDCGRLEKNALGSITRLSGGKGLAEIGDRVTVTFKRNSDLAPGARLQVFKVTEDLLSPSSDEEDEGEIEVSLGVLVLTKKINAKNAVAKVVECAGEIETGNLVRLEVREIPK